MRDRIVYRLCNFILRRFASKEYQNHIEAVVAGGLMLWRNSDKLDEVQAIMLRK